MKPSNPYDAKGIIINSIFGNTPTIVLENRSLFSMQGPVENKMFRINESPKLICSGKK